MAGAEVNNPVCRPNHTGFVLDNDNGVAQVTQVFQDFDQPAGVARVQTDARFVEDIQCVDEPSAQARRQIHAFGFATGQRARRTVERQVAKSDFDQIADTRTDFMEHQPDWVGGFGLMP